MPAKAATAYSGCCFQHRGETVALRGLTQHPGELLVNQRRVAGGQGRLRGPQQGETGLDLQAQSAGQSDFQRGLVKPPGQPIFQQHQLAGATEATRPDFSRKTKNQVLRGPDPSRRFRAGRAASGTHRRVNVS